MTYYEDNVLYFFSYWLIQRQCCYNIEYFLKGILNNFYISFYKE